MNRRSIVLLIAVLLFLGNRLKGQSYNFRHYQVEQGLSHNSVTSILQDKHGFLWFGTKDGLNRFDGYTFKVFRRNPHDSASLGSNSIIKLYESNGTLWVGTDKGLYQYNEKTEEFHLLKVTSNSSIRDIEKDHQGNLWFISGLTLNRYNESQKTLQTYETNHHFYATSICKTGGDLWISTTSGTLNKYDPKYDSFISYDVFEHSEPATTKFIETVCGTSQKSILIGTQSQGIKLFDVQNTEYQDILPNDPDNSGLFVRDFIESTENEYWAATESGIYTYNIDKGTITNLRKNNNDPYSISDNAVYSVFQDREGGIWAGTYFGGINYYPRQFTSFEKYFPKAGENSISGNAVREICQDQYDNFWIGTEDAGLNKYDPKTGIFTNFKPTGEKSSISHYNIHGLLATGNELWIGTFYKGLDVMDIKTGKVIRHYSAGPEPGALQSDFIYSIHQISSGTIYISTSAGLHQYLPETDSFTTLEAFPTSYLYTQILEDSRGTLWAGTYSDGLFYKNFNIGEKGCFRNDPKSNSSLSSNSVFGIYEDSFKNLWIATGEGLNKFNRQDNSFKNYTTQNGFLSNVIYRVQEDTERKLWISTSKGLVWFDPVSEHLKVFTKAHGLLSDQLNYGSSYLDQSGKMYFGSAKGMVSFNPAEFKINLFVPPIYFTGFQVHNKELQVNKDNSPLQKSIAFTDKITLNHKQSSFSLDFAALNYTAPGMAEYAYILKGFDKDWTYLKTNRKVFFTELPPGNYTFMVKASNGSGIWNENAARLDIEILPPLYASIGAYVLYSILFILIGYLGISNYHKKAEKKNKRKVRLLEVEKEKEVYYAKIEFFTRIAHEIRTPLTLISGPLENILKNAGNFPDISKNLLTMERNTSRLLNLVNQLLDFRKAESKEFQLSFVKVNISDLLEETFFRFKTAAEQKHLSFTLALPEAPLVAYVDQEALIKILSNLFSNAIKYSESIIQVKLVPFTTNDSSFIIEVRNDGHLIPAEMKEKIFEPFFRLVEKDLNLGTGIGLPLSRSLAELHSGSLGLKMPENRMNVFELILPIHQEHEFNLYNESHLECIKEDVQEKPNLKSVKPAVLLVEDNKEMMDFISSDLSSTYSVYKAFNGEQALKILEKETIHLIVSDVMMEGMDGLELCMKIKSNLDVSHIPFILLTAKNTLQSKIEGLESGADAYIEKPFSPEHLRVQIANLLNSRYKLKQFFSNSPLAHIKSIAYSKADEGFLEELNEAIQKNISDTNLNVDLLADIMNMSRPTFYRKIKAISDLTPNELINLARLKKAAELLTQEDLKIYEIATMVGYNSQTSFGRNFLKQFGMTPSEYASKKDIKQPN